MLLPSLDVTTHHRTELVDITERVQAALKAARLENGAVIVYSPHTTAGIALQEGADPDVKRDLLLALENAVGDAAVRQAYRHAEGNSSAHVKTTLTGNAQTIPVAEGRMLLGTWQAIYLCEFDGPRSRQVLIQAMPG